MIGDSEVGKQCAGFARRRKANILAIAQHGKVTQHADFQRRILFVGHFCRRYLDHRHHPSHKRNPKKQLYFIRFIEPCRYRRSNADALMGPAENCSNSSRCPLSNKSVVCHTTICDVLLPPDWPEVGALTLARSCAKLEWSLGLTRMRPLEFKSGSGRRRKGHTEGGLP